MRPRSLTFLVLAACLAAAAGMPVHASGKPETRLTEARRLIDAKQYDEALKLLIQVARDNPDTRDDTAVLMSQIISIRRQYNKKYEELIDVLTRGDVERGLALINELEALDPHPNPATVASLAKARKAAEVVFTAKAFRDLMAEALRQIKEKRYAEAILTYLRPIEHPDAAGFDMQKNDFLKAGYGDILVNSVAGSVSRLTVLAQGVRAASGDLQAAVEDASSVVGSSEKDQGALLSRYEASISRVRAVADAEAGLRRQVGVLEAAAKAAAEQGGDTKARLYIRYLLQLLGRGDSEGGIVLATRLLWDDAARRIAARADESATSAFARALALSRTPDSARAGAAFDLASSRAVMAAEAVGLETARLAPSPGWNFTLQDREDLKELAARAGTYQEIGAESRAYKLLAGMQSSLAAMPSVEGLAPDALPGVRARALEALDSAERRRIEWERRAASIDSQTRTGVSLEALAGSARTLAGLFGELAAGIQGRDLSYASALAESQSAGFTPRYAALHAARVRAEDLMNGTHDGGQGADEGLPKYPAQAEKIFEETAQGLRTLGSDLGKLSLVWSSEKPYVTGGPRVTAVRAAASSLQMKALAEANLIDEFIRVAQDQHNKAVEQERLGDQAFDRAVALAKTDPERAGDLLTEASDAYGRSLQFEDNPAVSVRLDKDIRDLRERIAFAINSGIITDVENLMSEGIKLFVGGDYVQANQKFNQADQRWKEKHPGQSYSSDLEYYLTLSRNALSVSGSREILPTDPSYDVVSSYINLANQSLREAEGLIQQGKRTAARTALDAARQSVASVLALYPNYRVARVLDLRILRLTDEKAFPAQLQRQIGEYTRGLRLGAVDRKEAYLGLKNIQEFLPNDKKLAATVEELEYDLGVKPRPLPQEKIRESTRLTAQATANYRKDVPETFQPSLRLLALALSANPNNEEARRLRTAILIRSGSPVEGALSKQALSDYLRAKDLLNSGSINEAKIIVDRLMRDPKNSAYPPLVELKGKIDARLGI